MTAPPWLPVAPSVLRQQLMSMDVGHGALEIYRPAANVIYTRARGTCATTLAEAWVTSTADIWPTVDKLTVFNDWQLMTNYESAARAALTNWVLTHRLQFNTAWFSSGSRLVSMGVSVASVATSVFGVPLHAPPERETFLQQLTTALAAPRRPTAS